MSAGLSSLEALKQKLAQDQARLASGGGTKPYRPVAPSPRPPEDLSFAPPPHLVQPAPQPLLGAAGPAGQPVSSAAGGANSAVSYLRAASVMESEDGRCSAMDVDREASAIARKAVETAVDTCPDGAGRLSGSGVRSTTPRTQQVQGWLPESPAPEAAPPAPRRPSLLLAQAQVTPSAPSSPPAALRPQPGRHIRPSAAEAPVPPPELPGPEGGGVGFESDPVNFTHILRFMRDGEGWQPPDDVKAIAALKKEAVFFGCTGMLNRLDKDEVERAGIEKGSRYCSGIA